MGPDVTPALSRGSWGSGSGDYLLRASRRVLHSHLTPPDPDPDPTLLLMLLIFRYTLYTAYLEERERESTPVIILPLRWFGSTRAD